MFLHVVSIKHGLWTADYGPGIKRGLENMGGYKRRTSYKTRTTDCGLSIKYRLRTR